MAANDNLIDKLNLGCRTKKACESEDRGKSYEDFLNGDWEVFVIKHDRSTGKFVGKLACCALARV